MTVWLILAFLAGTALGACLALYTTNTHPTEQDTTHDQPARHRRH